MDVLTSDHQLSTSSINNSWNTTQSHLSDFPHHVVIATIYILTAVFGIVDNGLVILGVATCPKLRTPTNVLIVNLALADLLTCMALPFQTVGVLSAGNQFPLPDIVCMIVGSIIYVTFACSGMNLVLIAIIRCYVITKNIRGKMGLNTLRKQMVLGVMAWILASACVYIPVYGFKLTNFSYYPPYRQCFTSPTSTSDMYHFYLALLFGVLLAIIMACYLRILVYLRSQRIKFRVHFGSSRSRRLHRAVIKRMGRREVKVTLNLFLVYVTFVLCAVPTMVTFIIPEVVYIGVYSTAILYLNNCLNPFLYAYRHPLFRRQFLELLKQVLKALGYSGKERPPPVRTISVACVHAMNISQYPVTSNLVP